MIVRGELPSLEKIAEQGSYAPLRSFPPYLSPRVWTTVATGKTPVKHGIASWVKQTEKGTSELFYSYDRQTHALWNIVSDRGYKVGVVNWLETFPPEIVNGVVVSDHTFPADIQGKTYIAKVFAKAQGNELEDIHGPESGAVAVFPKEWAERVLDERHTTRPLTDFENPFTENRPFPATVTADIRKQLAGFFERDEQLVSIALEIEKDVRPDVTLVLLQGIDRVSHFLWACVEDPSKYPPQFQPTAAERESCKRALEEFYRFTDALVGRLAASYGDDDLVMVVSDHGFEMGFRGASLIGDHTSDAAAHGVFFARGKNIVRGTPNREITVNDVTPTVLAWLGLPLAADMDGTAHGVVESLPDEKIATYDTTPIARVGGETSGGEGEMMDQLRSLGYVE